MDVADMTAAIISALALSVSIVALTLTILQRRRERIETYIEGLRGDRRAVTYAALTIRLAGILRNNDYRRSLVASLLLAWNFETSDRARTAVLTALVAARLDFPDDYTAVVADLKEMFTDYERIVSDGDINRGQNRLRDVTSAVNAAVQLHALPDRSSQAVA